LDLFLINIKVYDLLRHATLQFVFLFIIGTILIAGFPNDKRNSYPFEQEGSWAIYRQGRPSDGGLSSYSIRINITSVTDSRITIEKELYFEDSGWEGSYTYIINRNISTCFWLASNADLGSPIRDLIKLENTTIDTFSFEIDSETGQESIHIIAEEPHWTLRNYTLDVLFDKSCRFALRIYNKYAGAYSYDTYWLFETNVNIGLPSQLPAELLPIFIGVIILLIGGPITAVLIIKRRSKNEVVSG